MSRERRAGRTGETGRAQRAGDGPAAGEAVRAAALRRGLGPRACSCCQTSLSACTRGRGKPQRPLQGRRHLSRALSQNVTPVLSEREGALHSKGETRP